MPQNLYQRIINFLVRRILILKNEVTIYFKEGIKRNLASQQETRVVVDFIYLVIVIIIVVFK